MTNVSNGSVPPTPLMLNPPLWPERTTRVMRGVFGSAYQELEQPASGYPIAGVAAIVGSTSGGGSWDLVRIAVTGVGDHAYRATAAEAALTGTSGDDAAIAAAVARVTDGQTVNGDIHADPTYRAAMAGVMAKRAIELARARLG